MHKQYFHKTKLRSRGGMKQIYTYINNIMEVIEKHQFEFVDETIR